MKKLLDETTDELTRALLLSGVEHRPPSGNKAQLIVALGAGSALGLFSSNALAWFGTSAGKLTVLGVTLAVAGAVYAVAPVGTAEPSAGAPRGVPAFSPPNGAQASALDPLDGPGGRVASAAGPLRPVPSGLVPSGLVPGGPAASGPAPSEAQRDGAPDIESVPPKREPRRNGPLPAVDTPPAVGALGKQRVDKSRLDAEVSLVDDMHWAARRNDREALGRFLETYRLTFPDGELKKEVSEFALRLERPITP